MFNLLSSLRTWFEFIFMKLCIVPVQVSAGAQWPAQAFQIRLKLELGQQAWCGCWELNCLLKAVFALTWWEPSFQSPQVHTFLNHEEIVGSVHLNLLWWQCDFCPWGHIRDDYIYWFVHGELPLHLWNEANLIMGRSQFDHGGWSFWCVLKSGWQVHHWECSLFIREISLQFPFLLALCLYQVSVHSNVTS